MNYNLLCAQLEALAGEEGWHVSLLSNASALLHEALSDVNWAGFYLMRSGQLALGPFQGKTACIHIPLDRGVCGAAARLNATQRVADVHAFPGHIACDSASNSEIVIPIHKGGDVAAVLDIDSPVLNRFSQEDQAGLEAFVKCLERYLEWE